MTPIAPFPGSLRCRSVAAIANDVPGNDGRLKPNTHQIAARFGEPVFRNLRQLRIPTFAETSARTFTTVPKVFPPKMADLLVIVKAVSCQLIESRSCSIGIHLLSSGVESQAMLIPHVVS